MKLLLGGSPCTHWSIAQCKGRETAPAGKGWELFRNYLIAREKFCPDYFLYENNKSISPAIQEQITKELGVAPILINSALVSAQNRQRLYWTNIPGVEQPEDRGLVLRDILDSGVALQEKGYTLKANYHKASAANALDDGHFPAPMAAVPVCVNSKSGRGGVPGLQPSLSHRIYAIGGKATAITAGFHPNIAEPVTIHRLGGLYGQDSRWGIFDPDGKAPCLTASAGMGGGHIPMYPTRVMPGREYEVPTGMAWRGHARYGNPSSFEIRGDQKANAVIVGHQNRLVVELADGKTYPVHEVKDHKISIRGREYPIRLADGFYIIRKLSVRECMRLQTVPEDFVFPVSDTQAYKMLGNGWTVDVIAHILSYCPGITERPLAVLSMYDGMSCGQIALNKLGAKLSRYYATEIDKYAIQTTMTNFPDTVQLGNAFAVRDRNWMARLDGK